MDTLSIPVMCIILLVRTKIKYFLGFFIKKLTAFNKPSYFLLCLRDQEI